MGSIHGSFHGPVALGVLTATPLFGQNAIPQTAATAATPPLFQSVMVDAKGKTVGSYVFAATVGNPSDVTGAWIVRQINKTWVLIPITDFTGGFYINDPTTIVFRYQSADCTGQPYLLVNKGGEPIAPAVGIVAIVPPATAPSIYFAGAGSMITWQSYRELTNPLPND